MDRRPNTITSLPTRHAPPNLAREHAAFVPFDLAAAISEREVWRLAQLMLDGYGEAALYRAAILADETALRGDGACSSAWRRILLAIGELARDVPEGKVH